jgi:hypothetical protein
MFVRDFIHMAQPFERVAPRFVSDTSWLVPIAEEAADVARSVAVTLLGQDQFAPPPPGEVRCEVGPVRARAHGIVVPMWLIDRRGHTALPDLTGDLEVAPVGSNRSLIALGATYRRPTRDPDAIHRVERATEAGVRTFLEGIALVLGHPVSPI